MDHCRFSAVIDDGRMRLGKLQALGGEQARLFAAGLEQETVQVVVVEER